MVRAQRPQPQSKTFKTKAAAEAWRAQLQANFDRHSRMRGDAPMTDLLLQPMLARGPDDYELSRTIGSSGASCCPMLHRPRGHGCGRWITSSIKAASRRTATKQGGRPPCRRLPGAGLREHDPRVAPRRAKPGGRTVTAYL